ncbi:MAG TPA: glycosyl hydrolase family 28-related protein [Allosphingosinicella sp.]|nr:glycosyl hydrolase family 28-related protein [Allosphingosinicella sp.]
MAQALTLKAQVLGLDYSVGYNGTVARPVEDKLREMVSVKDFGAVGNDIADDTAAIAAAYASGAATVFFPSGSYRTSAEIVAINVNSVGDGMEAVTITATAPMTSLLKVNGQNVEVRGMFLSANAKADHGLYMNGTNGGLVEDVLIQSSKKDGIFFAMGVNNSNTVVRRCCVRGAGTSIVCTVTNSAGGTVVTVSGAGDLTTRGIRPFYDMVEVGGFGYSIRSVDSASQVTVSQPIANATAAGAGNIRIGSAVLVTNNGDNSSLKIELNQFQGAAVAGIRNLALYGVQDRGNYFENCEYGHTIGCMNGGTGISVMEGTVSLQSYFEESGSSDFLIENCTGVIFEPAQLSTASNPYLNAIRCLDWLRASGVEFRYRGATFCGAVSQQTNIVTLAAADVRCGVRYDFVQSTGASNFVIELPDPTAGSNLAGMMGALDAKIEFQMMDIGGKTASFQSVGNINQSAADYLHTGNYVLITARYNATYGWALTKSA